ncbi:phosphodiester glycosidase family protein [Cohnella sp. GCM10027633]|uniref:phosphodiester glycosidase family protein n=1 Tax=unclassified Cohnella TaxID=2636738 RepID=UPI00362D041E
MKSSKTFIHTAGRALAMTLLVGLLASGGASAAVNAPSVPGPSAPTTPTAPVVTQPGGASSPSGSGSRPAANAAPGSPFLCPKEAVRVPLNKRFDFAGLVYAPVDSAYASGNAKVATVTKDGLIVPQAKGSAKLVATGWTRNDAGVWYGYTCEANVEVVDAVASKPALAPKPELRSVKVGKTTFRVQAVFLPKGMPVDIGVAGNAVGRVEELKSIAARARADVAVNGTFFEAYDVDNPQEPLGNLIKNGEAIHLGHYGTTIGFTADGKAKMDTLRVKVQGGGNGSYAYPNNWYATFVNRTPNPDGNSSILFTPARGSRIGFAYGTAIVVQGGVVKRIAHDENAAIPTDGFVVVLNGAEERTLGNKFEVGKRIHYRLAYQDMNGNAIDWGDVVTAVGAGPRVLKDGKVYNDAAKEGFKQDKILTTPAARSGIGIRKDGSVVIVTAGKATIKELGEILKALGAVQGMNLDGGASSGLFAKGRLLTVPGRQISNSLLFGSALRS